MEQASIFDFNVEDKHYEYKKVFKQGQTIKLFEAFAGIGCQAMAFKRAGIPYETVGISEIDKYAIQSYNLIHDNLKNYGDISKMVEIPKCDVFTWSFPCTDLSKAGKQKGMQGTRSGLVYEVLRLLSVTKDKPRVLIMENVPDLVQEKFKAEFYEIQKEIESYGYKNFTQRLNAKHYGVAQNRDRVFMVSILGDYHYEFPTREKLKLRLKDYLEDKVDEKYYLSDDKIAYMKNTSFNTSSYGFMVHKEDEVARTLCARDYKDPKCVQVAQLKGKHEESGRVYSNNGLAPTINTMQGGNREPKIAEPICLNSKVNGKQPSVQDRVYDTNGTSTAITTSFMPSIAIPEATKQGYALASDGDGVYINRPHQKRGVVQKGMIQTLKTSGEDVGVVVDTYNKKVLDNQNVIGTITANTGTYGHCGNFTLNNGLRIRKLTPKECWRLMGISDEDFDKVNGKVSNSQLYKQAGNGIVVDVFAKILKGLVE